MSETPSPQALPLRPFGSTGLRVSPLGLGTVKLGRDKGVKYPTRFTIPDDRQAANLLAQARDCGINLIDTAPAYGNSEERLGTLLAGQRQDWIICSKVGEEFDPATGESHYDFSARHTRMSIERSLRRLNTDRLEIVLIHSDGNDQAILDDGGALRALQDCQREGLVRAIGMSTKTVAGGLRAAERCDAVMVTYNPAHTGEAPVLDFCAKHHKAAIVKKALASGHLAGDGDPAQAALAFVLGHPGVASVIVGTINPAHLRQNVNACLTALDDGV